MDPVQQSCPWSTQRNQFTHTRTRPLGSGKMHQQPGVRRISSGPEICTCTRVRREYQSAPGAPRRGHSIRKLYVLVLRKNSQKMHVALGNHDVLYLLASAARNFLQVLRGKEKVEKGARGSETTLLGWMTRRLSS